MAVPRTRQPTRANYKSVAKETDKALLQFLLLSGGGSNQYFEASCTEARKKIENRLAYLKRIQKTDPASFRRACVVYDLEVSTTTMKSDTENGDGGESNPSSPSETARSDETDKAPTRHLPVVVDDGPAEKETGEELKPASSKRARANDRSESDQTSNSTGHGKKLKASRTKTAISVETDKYLLQFLMLGNNLRFSHHRAAARGITFPETRKQIENRLAYLKRILQSRPEAFYAKCRDYGIQPQIGEEEKHAGTDDTTGKKALPESSSVVQQQGTEVRRSGDPSASSAAGQHRLLSTGMRSGIQPLGEAIALARLSALQEDEARFRQDEELLARIDGNAAASLGMNPGLPVCHQAALQQELEALAVLQHRQALLEQTLAAGGLAHPHLLPSSSLMAALDPASLGGVPQVALTDPLATSPLYYAFLQHPQASSLLGQGIVAPNSLGLAPYLGAGSALLDTAPLMTPGQIPSALIQPNSSLVGMGAPPPPNPDVPQPTEPRDTNPAT